MDGSYHQFCAIARALELVGQRWTLLLVRELLLRGPLSAAAIGRGLPDIPPNQLAERLIHLEAARLVVAGDVPTPGAGHREYALTAKGRQLEGIIDALAEFGLTCLHEPRSSAEHVLPHVLMRQLELRYDHERAMGKGFNGRFALVLEDAEALWSVERGRTAPRCWVVEANDRRLQIRPGACTKPDATLHMTVATCTALIARQPDAVLPLRIDGDRVRALGLLALLQQRRGSTNADRPPLTDRVAPPRATARETPTLAAAG
jgi:DNA-binding HxlR family transcriptional regulator